MIKKYIFSNKRLICNFFKNQFKVFFHPEFFKYSIDMKKKLRFDFSRFLTIINFTMRILLLLYLGKN